jgi:hypothetical protein
MSNQFRHEIIFASSVLLSFHRDRQKAIQRSQGFEMPLTIRLDPPMPPKASRTFGRTKTIGCLVLPLLPLRSAM